MPLVLCLELGHLIWPSRPMYIRFRIADCQCVGNQITSKIMDSRQTRRTPEHNNVKANKDNDDKINESCTPFRGEWAGLNLMAASSALNEI